MPFQTTVNDNAVMLAILADSSGSMIEMDPPTVAASLNRTIQEQVKTEKDVRVFAATFDDNYSIVVDNVPAAEVTITPEAIAPDGCTALFDAIKSFVGDVESRLADAAGARPSKVIAVIVTDGEENASKFTTRDEVMSLIKQKQEQEQEHWEFVFLGANQDAIGVGAGYGIQENSSIEYDYSPAGFRNVMRSASQAITRTITGETPRVEFTDEERQESQCVVPDCDTVTRVESAPQPRRDDNDETQRDDLIELGQEANGDVARPQHDAEMNWQMLYLVP